MENSTTTEAVDETSTVTEPQTETVTSSTTATDERSETTETTTKPEASQPSTNVDDLTKELAQLKAQLKKVNAESAAHRHKAKELDDLKAQIEAEKLSEKEKLEKKLSELQLQHDTTTRQAQERIINYEVRLQAAQMGIVDPDAAAKLLDWSEIEYEDNGSPTNVQELLNALVKAKPYLKAQQGRQATTSGGATNPPRSTTSSTTLPDTLSWGIVDQLFADNAKGLQALLPAEQKRVAQWMGLNTRRR